MPTIAAITAGDARFNVLVSALQYVDTTLPGTNLLSALSGATANLTVAHYEVLPNNLAEGVVAKAKGQKGHHHHKLPNAFCPSSGQKTPINPTSQC